MTSPGRRSEDVVPAVGHDEQPPVTDLPSQLPGLADRDERVAIAADDQRRRRDRAQLRGGQQRLDRHVLRDRGQQALPGAGALGRIERAGQVGRPRRLVAQDPGRVHEPAGHAGPRLAIGCDPGHDERPDAVRVRGPRTRARSSRPSSSRTGGRSPGRTRRRSRRGRRRATRPGTRPRRPSVSSRGPGRPAGRPGRRSASGSICAAKAARPVVVAPWSMTRGGPAPTVS